MQQPLPELSELRQPQTAWHAGTAAAAAGKDLGSTAPAVPLPPRLPLPVGRNGSDSRSSSSSSVDLELQVAKGDADSFVLLLHAFEGAEGAAGAAIAYCWSTNTLQVRAAGGVGVLGMQQLLIAQAALLACLHLLSILCLTAHHSSLHEVVAHGACC